MIYDVLHEKRLESVTIEDRNWSIYMETKKDFFLVYCNLYGYIYHEWVSCLTHYFTWLFKGRLLNNYQTKNFTNLENRKKYIDKELKILQ